MKLNKNKFSNLILYICSQCSSLPNFGRTVLYKLLYFSDFDFYELTRNSITGETYYKLDHGPAPSSFNNMLKEMKKKKEVKEIAVDYMGHKQKRLIPLKKPNISLFTSQEIEIINNVVKKLSGMTATQISAYSHQDVPWKASKMREKIEYQLVFYRDDVFSVKQNH